MEHRIMPAPSLLSRITSRVLRDAKFLLGVDSYQETEDRRVLEQKILKYFTCNDVYRHVLFVGCHWYTHGYENLFEKHDYWTLEIDPSHRKYGAKQHIVDGMQSMAKYFERGSLDLIICNGVFGWGLDDRPDVEQAFGASFECLREGGVLVLGWDDIDKCCPFPLDQCASLQRFRPFVFPPLRGANYVTNTPYRHTYRFFEKPLTTHP